MWWKFRRHRIAVIAGAILLAVLRLDADQRVHRAVQPAHARHAPHLRAAAARAPLPRGQLRRPVRLRLQHASSTCETLKREYTPDRSAGAAAALLLPGRRVRVLGPGRRHASTSSARPRAARCSCSAPTGSGATCFSRIVYGTRISLTVGPARHRGELPHRHHARRHLGLLRRLDRQRDPALHRDGALLPRAAAVDGALGGAAGELEPDPGLLRHHHHPRPARLAGPGARGALEAAGAARRGLRHRRGADGREPGARHPPPPAAELHQPPDRLGHALGAGDDPRRDRAFVPRPGPAAAGDQLGRAAERGAEHQRGRALPLADARRCVPVFIVVLAFNFFGDGLRDAADPYSSAART